MRCYSCSLFPGSHQTLCPGPHHEVDEGVACTVRQLTDKTVVYQGNVPKASGCSEEMIQHYNFLTDKLFRLGNSRSAGNILVKKYFASDEIFSGPPAVTGTSATSPGRRPT